MYGVLGALRCWALGRPSLRPALPAWADGVRLPGMWYYMSLWYSEKDLGMAYSWISALGTALSQVPPASASLHAWELQTLCIATSFVI